MLLSSTPATVSPTPTQTPGHTYFLLQDGGSRRGPSGSDHRRRNRRTRRTGRRVRSSPYRSDRSSTFSAGKAVPLCIGSRTMACSLSNISSLIPTDQPCFLPILSISSPTAHDFRISTVGYSFLYSPSTDREVESKWEFSVATPNFFTNERCRSVVLRKMLMADMREGNTGRIEMQARIDNRKHKNIWIFKSMRLIDRYIRLVPVRT